MGLREAGRNGNQDALHDWRKDTLMADDRNNCLGDGSDPPEESPLGKMSWPSIGSAGIAE